MTDSEHPAVENIDSEVEALPEETVKCVAAIGASAGGLKALETLFQHLPAHTGIAYIVVQHLAPDFKSLMDEILPRHTHMPVVNSTNGMKLEADKIFLIPRRKNLAVDDGRLIVTEIDREEMQRPVDVLLQSVAQSFGSRSVGIILSGTGSDGVVGIRAIHEAGGLTVAQSPETAQFDGMPANAVASKCVDLVLPPEEIAQLLTRHGEDPTQRFAAEEFLTNEELSGINLVFSLLCERHGIDFADYKSTTVGRRIERRIQAKSSRSMHEYAKLLQTDNVEVDLLYHDLLIGVTKFFRDSEAFFALRTRLSEVIAKLDDGQELRIWSAACATGEEPYTIAMIALEIFAHQSRPVNMKILATDVHQGALDHAAHGVYSSESLEFVTPDRQARFFTPANDGKYRITSEV